MREARARALKGSVQRIPRTANGAEEARVARAQLERTQAAGRFGAAGGHRAPHEARVDEGGNDREILLAAKQAGERSTTEPIN